MIVRTAVLTMLVLMLGACGSLSAPPGDTFYRLRPLPASAGADVRDQRAHVFVPPLAASGLHSERALLYVHGDDRTLEQYSYHLWIDSPRFLLQHALAARLERELQFRTVTEVAPDVGRVKGRIIRFERQATDSGSEALVTLHFDVYRPDERVPVLSRSFSANKSFSGDDMAAYVAATDEAVDEVLGQLTTTLAEVW